MAIQKAQSPKVKEYAQMLVTDHTQSVERLRGLTTESRSGTAAMNQRLARKNQQEIDRLSRLSGTEFDWEFMRVSIQNHREALPLYDRYANLDAINDRTVLYAKDMLPVERKHLLRAEEIQREMQTTRR
jgi:putative membrane protein